MAGENSTTPSVEWTPEQLDALFQLEVAKRQSEAWRTQAEARSFDALAAKTITEAEVARIFYEREREKRVYELADDDHHLVLRFLDDVMEEPVQRAISKLSAWSRLHPGEDIEIVFFSAGGSVVDGMALFDFILSLRRQGHKITTRASGYACSMAGILLQAGDVRIMESQASLLIHPIWGVAIGTTGEIDDHRAWYDKLERRILDLFYKRTAGAKKRLTRSELRQAFERKDWWLDAREALAYGFCDKVA